MKNATMTATEKMTAQRVLAIQEEIREVPEMFAHLSQGARDRMVQNLKVTIRLLTHIAS